MSWPASAVASILPTRLASRSATRTIGSKDLAATRPWTLAPAEFIRSFMGIKIGQRRRPGRCGASSCAPTARWTTAAHRPPAPPKRIRRKRADARDFGRKPPAGLSKDLLGRMIAMRIQEQAFGGLDRDSLTLLDGPSCSDSARRAATQLKDRRCRCTAAGSGLPGTCRGRVIRNLLSICR
jgi:hypothetical protein